MKWKKRKSADVNYPSYSEMQLKRGEQIVSSYQAIFQTSILCVILLCSPETAVLSFANTADSENRTAQNFVSF